MARPDTPAAEGRLIKEILHDPEIRRDAVRYWIALYKALGGGWDTGAASQARQTKTQGLY